MPAPAASRSMCSLQTCTREASPAAIRTAARVRSRPCRPYSHSGMATSSPLSNVDDDGDVEPAAGGDRGDARRHGPIRMNHVERAGGAKRADEPAEPDDGADARAAFGAAEIVNRRAGERVAARVVVVAQREHVNGVPPRQPLDQPHERGDDPFAAAAIEAAWRDEGDPHHAAGPFEVRARLRATTSR